MTPPPAPCRACVRPLTCPTPSVKGTSSSSPCRPPAPPPVSAAASAAGVGASAGAPAAACCCAAGLLVPAAESAPSSPRALGPGAGAACACCSRGRTRCTKSVGAPPPGSFTTCTCSQAEGAGGRGSRQGSGQPTFPVGSGEWDASTARGAGGEWVGWVGAHLQSDVGRTPGSCLNGVAQHPRPQPAARHHPAQQQGDTGRHQREAAGRCSTCSTPPGPTVARGGGGPSLVHHLLERASSGSAAQCSALVACCAVPAASSAATRPEERCKPGLRRPPAVPCPSPQLRARVAQRVEAQRVPIQVWAVQEQSHHLCCGAGGCISRRPAGLPASVQAQECLRCGNVRGGWARGCVRPQRRRRLLTHARPTATPDAAHGGAVHTPARTSASSIWPLRRVQPHPTSEVRAAAPSGAKSRR